MRFDAIREPNLNDFLHNVVIAGGGLVVIDEAFFICADDMVEGLEEFVNSQVGLEGVRLVVVCSDRYPGDALLAHLVTYCGIFNIVYGKSGAELAAELRSMAMRDNMRSDVIHLVEREKWEYAKKADALAQRQSKPAQDCLFRSREGELYVDVEDVKLLKVAIRLEALSTF